MDNLIDRYNESTRTLSGKNKPNPDNNNGTFHSPPQSKLLIMCPSVNNCLCCWCGVLERTAEWMHLVIKRVYLFLIPLFSPQTHEAQAALIVTAQQGSGWRAELGVSGYACVCVCACVQGGGRMCQSSLTGAPKDAEGISDRLHSSAAELFMYLCFYKEYN